MRASFKQPSQLRFAHYYTTRFSIYHIWIAISLSWWKSRGIDNLVGVFDGLVLWLEEWRAWESHETGAGGLEYAEGGDELHEGVDAGWLGGAVSLVRTNIGW